MHEPIIQSAMQRLVNAELIIPAAADEYTFRHALTREAAYSTMLIRERYVLHRLVGDALERLHANDVEPWVAELAHHYYQAQQWEKALHYARRAGERAQRLYAPQEAAEQFTRALEAARHLPQAPLAELHRLRAYSYEIRGDFARARADLEAGLNAARDASDRHQEWQALLDCGQLWASHDYAQTGEYFERALELAQTLGDDATLAHSLNRKGNWQVNIEQPQLAVPQHEQALAIFRARDDRRGVAETLDLLGMATYLGCDAPTSAHHLEQAVALFRELNDPKGLASSLTTLSIVGTTLQTATIVTEPQRLREGVAVASEALATTRQIGWRAGAAFALFSRAVVQASLGKFEPALRDARQALVIAQEIDHRQWLTAAHNTLGLIYLQLGAHTHAQLHAAEALTLAHEIGSLHWTRCARAALGMAHIAAHEPTRAADVLRNDAEPNAADMRTIGQRQLWQARVELALQQGDAARAHALTAALEASARGRRPERVIAELTHLRARSMLALQPTNRTEAIALLQAAAASARLEGLLPTLWRIDATLGSACAADGQTALAQQARAEAQAIVDELSAQLEDADLRETFRRAAEARLASGVP